MFLNRILLKLFKLLLLLTALCQEARQYWVLDSDSTEEIQEDWITRLFKAGEEEPLPRQSPQSSEKKKKKAPKKAGKAKAKAKVKARTSELPKL